MEDKEALLYVRENLGIDISASSFVPDPGHVQYVLASYPYKGILLLTTTNHLVKAGRYCWELLKAGFITGSIERFESWEHAEVSQTTGLLLYTNLAEDLVKPPFVIKAVMDCMKLNIPMMFTTPLTTEDLERSLPISVLSNVVPYLIGQL